MQPRHNTTPAPVVNTTVVGAGVVGLAVAAAMAEHVNDVVLLERHRGPGREVSTRNSEVIHAGIYYPPGSAKARLCVEGREMLYRFCKRHGVLHRRLGKLIVACSAADLERLARLLATGESNQVRGLRLLDRRAVRTLEPEISAAGALWSPESGIVDSHGLITALAADAQRAGAAIMYRCEVLDLAPSARGFSITVKNPGGIESFRSERVVNCAGLQADRVAALAGVSGYVQHWCRGDYFALVGPLPRISRLIYPPPTRTSLGIHLTLDVSGRMRLGPDTTYTDRHQPIADIDPSKGDDFYRAAQRFIPRLQRAQLRPDSSGIRPKLQGPGDAWCDFSIRQDLPGLINLVGIDSPGLTASLAIAQHVRRMLR